MRSSIFNFFDYEEIIITNTRAFEDIIARMRRLHVDEVVRCRCEWARYEYEWRQLRHQRAIDEFHVMINSGRFTNPPERIIYFDTVRKNQKKRHDKRETIIFNMINIMKGNENENKNENVQENSALCSTPYLLTTEIVKATSKEIDVIENEEDQIVVEILNGKYSKATLFRKM